MPNKKEDRNTMLPVPLSDRENSSLAALCAAIGVDVSTFVRYAIAVQIQDVIAGLDTERRLVVIEALEPCGECDACKEKGVTRDDPRERATVAPHLN